MIPTATSCTSMLGAEPDLPPRPRSVDLDPVGVGFPAWHFAMVNDGARNAAIERAIRALDLAGRTVVEVGTGTGVVALLFAEHGASRVVSCESHPVLARVARRAIDATPYGDRITIVQGSASEAIDQGLLPFAPDVLFIETLGCGVVGEGFEAIARDIGRIAGPHTTIMPKVVRQYAMLIDSAEVAALNRVGSACGFDLWAVNADFTARYFPVRIDRHRHRVLSESLLIRKHRYLGDLPAAPARVRVSRAGTVHGLVSWFSADLGAATITNEPYVNGHWHQAFHPLPTDLPVAVGQVLDVAIDDHGHATASVR